MHENSKVHNTMFQKLMRNELANIVHENEKDKVTINVKIRMNVYL